MRGELMEALFLLTYVVAAFVIAIVIWTDRKHVRLETWQSLCWIMIAIGLPFFLGVPLYFFYRSKRFGSREKG